MLTRSGRVGSAPCRPTAKHAGSSFTITPVAHVVYTNGTATRILVVSAKQSFDVLNRAKFKVLGYNRAHHTRRSTVTSTSTVGSAGAQEMFGPAPASRACGGGPASAQAPVPVTDVPARAARPFATNTPFVLAPVTITYTRPDVGVSGSGGGCATATTTTTSSSSSGGGSGGASAGKVVFSLGGNTSQEMIFVDPATGEVAGYVRTPGRYTVKLIAGDAGDAGGVGRGRGTDTVEEVTLEFRHADTASSANGPNGRGCGGGVAVDSEAFDGAFTCDCACSTARHTGRNCDPLAHQPLLTGHASPSNTTAPPQQAEAESRLVEDAWIYIALAVVAGGALTLCLAGLVRQKLWIPCHKREAPAGFAEMVRNRIEQ